MIDRQRYRRILFFFAGIILHLIAIDLFLGRIPLIRQKVWDSRPQRFRKMARRFRQLAAEMGGVLIKLGQFLSARVDVLPEEITGELAGLQDEVPPVPYADIEKALQTEFGDPTRHFAHFDPTPIAAASLGQVHQAWLLPSNPEEERGPSVVVKVQRPNIAKIVQTDLAALRVVARWAMRYKPIRRRADVPALMDEFARTLWEELDYRAEAANAERFSAMFQDDKTVRVPMVYWQHATERVLTLERVEGMKIDDVAGMEDAGILPAQVAERLLEIYFYQIFQEGFFHADPHAGNIFIRAVEGETTDGGTPFEIIFIDFGMMGRIDNLMGENLRRVLVSVVQRDVRALTQAYNDLGFLLPGADLERIEEVQGVVLDRIWGRSLLEMARPDPEEIKEIGLQFKDILLELPFQVPQDFVYLGRAFGMISGLTTQLHPDIDPWQQLEKFARDILVKEQLGSLSMDTVLGGIREFFGFPARARRVLKALEAGELQVRAIPAKATTRQLDRLEQRLQRLNSTVLMSALLVCGTLLYVNGQGKIGGMVWGIAGILWVVTTLRTL